MSEQSFERKSRPSKIGPVALIILDGFGLNPEREGNAVAQANTPTLDKLWETYPHTTLLASGEAVGLPEGQFGNSEVGHSNIGAGRILYQELTKINKAIREGDFFQNEVLKRVMNAAIRNDKTLHLCGLVSDGGVHSHIEHALALLRMAAGLDVKKSSCTRFSTAAIPHRKQGPSLLSASRRRWPISARAPLAPSLAVTTPWTATSVGSASARRTTRWSTARVNGCATSSRRFAPATTKT
ncbi:hypothetical protein GCM10025859_35410 [Alicyclobacillus fastidiosus]|nr:hypothetical protein GCM10025859_35410 [Alicyclobacillus fastidiosus]